MNWRPRWQREPRRASETALPRWPARRQSRAICVWADRKWGHWLTSFWHWTTHITVHTADRRSFPWVSRSWRRNLSALYKRANRRKIEWKRLSGLWWSLPGPRQWGRRLFPSHLQKPSAGKSSPPILCRYTATWTSVRPKSCRRRWRVCPIISLMCWSRRRNLMWWCFRNWRSRRWRKFTAVGIFPFW